jgi:response regulator NasT
MDRKMALKSIALAEDDPGVASFIKSFLARHSYDLVGHVVNGAEAVSLVQALKPHILLLDYHLPILNGLEVLKRVAPLETTAVVLITADRDPRVARDAMEAGASGYLLKPFEAAQIMPMLESAWHHFKNTHALQEQARALQDTLATRKLLDQAKGILMEQQGFTESEAHQMLLKMSQDQGLALKDVCKSLIQVRSVLEKKKSRGVDAAKRPR